MKTLFKTFLLAAFVTVSAFALPAAAQPSATTTLTTKADSLMVVAAGKLNIDTNASAEQIGEEIDTAISFVPGKHATIFAWIKFLMKLFILLVAVYFFIKHQVLLGAHNALKASAKAKGLTLMIVALIMLGMSSCSVTKTNLTPYGGTVSEQLGKGWYLKETIAIHTDTLQNDSAIFLLYGPNTYTNLLITDVKNYIEQKVGVPLKPVTPLPAK